MKRRRLRVEERGTNRITGWGSPLQKQRCQSFNHHQMQIYSFLATSQKTASDLSLVLMQVLEKMSAGGSTAAMGGPKRAKLQQGDDLLLRVASKVVTEKTLAARLLEHIERIDTDMVRREDQELGFRVCVLMFCRS